MFRRAQRAARGGSAVAQLRWVGSQTAEERSIVQQQYSNSADGDSKVVELRTGHKALTRLGGSMSGWERRWRNGGSGRMAGDGADVQRIINSRSP